MAISYLTLMQLGGVLSRVQEGGEKGVAYGSISLQNSQRKKFYNSQGTSVDCDFFETC